jgi:1,4-alpha-glucan branching enzyme
VWKRLGAHPAVRGGAAGVRFAVWAPKARAVAVTGDFNEWSKGGEPLVQGADGVWEGFVPGVSAGSVYKFVIRSRLGGHVSLKADPVAFAAELRPRTGSVVCAPSRHRWKDTAWMEARAAHQAPGRPMSIYEVHPGSWRPPAEGRATWDDLARDLVPYVRDLGFTHLELLPVTEHPFDGSWGYQTTGYFAPTARHGEPDGLRRFVDAAHGAGLGVLLDWVPAHFPRDAHGLGFFDGTPLYEQPDPRRAVHPDWDTYVFDYAKPEVVSFLVSNALYWLEEFHFDGLRVDAVASMIYLDYSRHPEEWQPNAKGGREHLEAIAFLRALNDALHEECPGALTLAEESTSWPGVTAPTAENGLGFDLKWNMGWMNDTLEYFRLDPLLRSGSQEKLTFSLTYAFSERYLLPLSHDEVVHGKASLLSKMPGTREQRFAGLRALFGYQVAHPGKKLLFMGAEIGQWKEWNHEASLEWDLLEHAPHRELQACVRALMRFYAERPELWEVDESWDGFEWIDHSDNQRSVISFLRRAKERDRHLLVAANFTPVAWERYRLGVPAAGAYRVAFRTDRKEFGGEERAIPARLEPESFAVHDREHSLVLDLPPLAVLFLEPVATPAARDAGRPVTIPRPGG